MILLHKWNLLEKFEITIIFYERPGCVLYIDVGRWNINNLIEPFKCYWKLISLKVIKK